MPENSPTPKARALYIPHGGGPLPLLGDARHVHMVSFLQNIVTTFPKPAAIIMVSAHWESAVPSITSGAQPQLIYDYSGFPSESYEFRYDAPGDPDLANEVAALITSHGGSYRLDNKRGFDHGLFIPLSLMYPAADIPCIQISLLNNLDPEQHIQLGQQLAALGNKNILFIGSGMSYHNMRGFFTADAQGTHDSLAFDAWLTDTCANPSLSVDEREQRLINWEKAPAARSCHPREEHLLPLHVCFGFAREHAPTARSVFNNEIMGKRASAYMWEL